MATKRLVAITQLYTHANNRRSPVRFPPSEDVCVPARGAEGVLWDPLGHRLRLTCFGSTSDTFYQSKGIKSETSVPYTPQQNGKACWTAGHLAAPAPASCPACSPTAPTALGRGQTESQMAKPKATRPTPAPAGKTQRSPPPTQCHLSAPSSWRRHLAATRHLAILPCMHIIPCISPCLSFSPSALPQ